MESSDKNNQKRKPKIYHDIAKFKGNSFEKNINSVNKLYLGLGLKISDVPYIYIDDSDKNIYLSAINFSLQYKGQNHQINYPASFIYKVFYYDGLLFYLQENNLLRVYQFNYNNLSIKYYETQQKTKEVIKKEDDIKEVKEIDNKKKKEKKEKKEKKDFTPKIIQLEIDTEKVSKALNMLKNIKNNNYKEDYEILCDVLSNYLNVKLEQQYPKEIANALPFEINDERFLNDKLTCQIKLIKYQIDSTGMIREDLQVGKGKIKFEKGIKSISSYIEFKDQITFNNSFKCPILYKNFEEEILPANKVILCEIKSGFNIEEIQKQLNERIDAIKYFKFNKEENPLYYIGIVNFYSKNKDKLSEYEKFDFDFKENKNEKILIVAVVDYVYFGIDLSHEVNDGYLLYKAILNLNKKVENVDKKVDNLEKKTDDNFNNLISELQRIFPKYKFTYITKSEMNKNAGKEEKKVD